MPSSVFHFGFVAQISFIGDSVSESSLIAVLYEQLDPYKVKDPELRRVQSFFKATGIARDLV